MKWKDFAIFASIVSKYSILLVLFFFLNYFVFFTIMYILLLLWTEKKLAEISTANVTLIIQFEAYEIVLTALKKTGI